MTRGRLVASVGVTLGYGLVALGGAKINGVGAIVAPILGIGVLHALIPWLGWGEVAAGLLLVAFGSRIPRGTRALPAPLASLPRTRGMAFAFVLRQIGVAFLLRWAVGGILFWIALPLLALADCMRREEAARRDVLASLVLYFVFYGYGIGGVWNFVGHFFMSDAVAASVGWPAGSPFQQELAFYALGTGVVGLMTPWWRGRFWVAAAVAPSIFVYGAAFTHIQEHVVNGNASPANWGAAAVGANLLIPTVVLLTTWLHHRAEEAAARS